MFCVVVTGKNTIAGRPIYHIKLLANCYMHHWIKHEYIFKDYIIYIGSEKENKTIRQNLFYRLLIQEAKEFLKAEFNKNEKDRIFEKVKWIQNQK